MKAVGMAPTLCGAVVPLPFAAVFHMLTAVVVFAATCPSASNRRRQAPEPSEMSLNSLPLCERGGTNSPPAADHHVPLCHRTLHTRRRPRTHRTCKSRSNSVSLFSFSHSLPILPDASARYIKTDREGEPHGVCYLGQMDGISARKCSQLTICCEQAGLREPPQLKPILTRGDAKRALAWSFLM